VFPCAGRYPLPRLVMQRLRGQRDRALAERDDLHHQLEDERVKVSGMEEKVSGMEESMDDRVRELASSSKVWCAAPCCVCV